jgi:flap endonuclease-1
VKQEAAEKKEEAVEEGNLAEALKQQQRTTYISKQEREDVKHMLELMGVPVIQAPGEAEAQCSYMCREGKVHGVCTEDTDCLVFGAGTMVRDVNNKKEPLTEISRERAIADLGLSEEQFIDMCILCGCDYATKI